MEEIATGA
jgi:hypothetical protein